MRRRFVHTALVPAAAALLVFTFTRFTSAGLVDVSPSTDLTANVFAELSGAGDRHDRRDAQDHADLSRHAVSAHAQAQLEIDAGSLVRATGNAVADLTTNPTGFRLTGSAATSLPEVNPFQSNTTAVNNTLVPFTVSDGCSTQVDFNVVISSMIENDQKVTLALNRVGESRSLFHQIFNQSISSTLDEVGPGSYQLLLVTGSLSTAKGVAGETGSADYHVTVTGAAVQPPPEGIPLPPAALPGGIMLALVLLGLHSRRISCQHAEGF